MPRLTPVLVFSFVFVVKYAAASGDFETIENGASQMFSPRYKPMPTKWSAFLANLVHNFNKKSVCTREMVKDLIVKLKVWKAIVDCYVECATRQEDGTLKMDYKKWRQESTDTDEMLAAGYIEILTLEDKNHIGKKLADHFEIVMQYVGGILERMKVCFKDEKDLISASLLNNVAMTKFNELSPNQATIVAKMRE